MGNKQSSAPPQCQPGCSPTSAVSTAIAAVSSRAPPVTPDPVSQCQANKIKANSTANELSTINSAIDSCDPSIPLARRRAALDQENRTFVNEQERLGNVLKDSIVDKFRMGTELSQAVQELKQYEKKLKNELVNAEKGALKMEHDERKYRRDFLDNQPTDGVPWHIFGLQTSDDKVMLTFWITALISFSLLAHVVLTNLSPNESLKGRAIKGTISVILALFASYLLIIYIG